MTRQPRSLKAQNAWLIRAALLLHAVAFAYVALDPLALAQLTGSDFLGEIKASIIPGSASLALIALTKLILLGMIPASFRDFLIHWRWRHPLPGSRAFTEIAKSDGRVDLEELERRFGLLPTAPDKQGSLFYRIFRAHADEAGVVDAHKSYLAARDIGVISFIFIVALPFLAWLINHDVIRAISYTIGLFCFYVLISLAARTYARRFVENVLAAASASK